jgi:hypothetical protein
MSGRAGAQAGIKRTTVGSESLYRPQCPHVPAGQISMHGVELSVHERTVTTNRHNVCMPANYHVSESE